MPGPHVLPCLLCILLLVAPWALDLSRRPEPQRVGLPIPGVATGPGEPELDSGEASPAPSRELGDRLGESELGVDAGLSMPRPDSDPALRADGNGRVLGLIMGALIGLGLWLSRRRLGE